MARNIRKLLPGAPIRASELNEILGECITDIRVAPPLFATKDGNSATIRMNAIPARGGGIGGGGGSAKLVKVVGTISGAIGYYQGRLQTAGAALDGAANVADAQLGTFAEADDSNKVLLVNLADLYAGTGHSISPSSNPKIFLAWPVSGMTSTNAWSSTVYFTEAYQPGAVCSA